MDFLVRRDDLSECRFAEVSPRDLSSGQARLAVDSFGLTSNNITYAVFGEAMSYWEFFPAEDGWGRIPVWGFAEVAASTVEGLAPGTRVFGYLPPSSHVDVTPDRVGEHGFVDASAHRSKLPAAYNGYVRVDADPGYDGRHEPQQMLLRPLFFTSWLIDDFLAENDLFGARAVVLSSASSKTALSAAFLLAQRDGVEVIGLTSPARTGFVERLGVYDRVATYAEIASLATEPAVYVDMSGDAEVRAAVHGHYRGELAHSCAVGATHWDRMGAPGDLPGPKPTFFFAPDRVAKRSEDWGGQGLERRLAEAWRPYVEWTAEWLEVERADGPEAVERVYQELLEGRIDPAAGHVLSLRAQRPA